MNAQRIRWHNLLGDVLQVKNLTLDIPANSSVTIPVGADSAMVLIDGGPVSSNTNLYHVSSRGTVSTIAGDNPNIEVVVDNNVIKYNNKYPITLNGCHAVCIW